MPDFSVQNNFPMAAVIQAAQQNAQRQMEANTLGNQSLIQGLQSIGQVGQNLLDRRRAMAQALAGAQLYANTPEGKEMLGTNQVTTGPSGQPVQQNQTAAYDQNTGTVTPNKPAIDLNTLATAFYGDKPSDMLKQMFEQHKLNVTTRLEEQKIENQKALALGLLGFRGKELSATDAANLRSSIANEQNRQKDAIKDFPELAGTFAKNVLPKGSNAQQEAAFKLYQDAQKNIDRYSQQLYGSGSGNTGSPTQHMSTADLLWLYNQLQQW